jgi:hypothetical protein
MAPLTGAAILGTQNICVVYSDDDGINNPYNGNGGIRHFYFKTYEIDYIRSSEIQLNGQELQFQPAEQWANDEFFIAHSTSQNDSTITFRAFALREFGADAIDAIVLDLEADSTRTDQFCFILTLAPEAFAPGAKNVQVSPDTALFTVDESAWLALRVYQGKAPLITCEGTTISVSGALAQGKASLIIAAAETKEGAVSPLDLLQSQSPPPDLFGNASLDWENWQKSGNPPKFPPNDPNEPYYWRNLYATWVANLGGMIPADLLGQFLTNGQPQLYPRDSLMCARSLNLAGYSKDAADIMQYWLGTIEEGGYWYARYGADGTAVDGGSGASYNTDEWDSNGYFIILYYQLPEENQFPDNGSLATLADFLVNKLATPPLLYEGGIVEWPGYLPSTNMTSVAALETMASKISDPEKAKNYASAAKNMRSSLFGLFNGKLACYCDSRPKESVVANRLCWNTSTNFGFVWGYREMPSDPGRLAQTNDYYATHCCPNSSPDDPPGMQYFNNQDKSNPGAMDYGHQLFSFTTAGAAQFAIATGNRDRARQYIDWLTAHTNVYGLMPERIQLDGSLGGLASPLSWGAAELAATILAYFTAFQPSTAKTQSGDAQ